MNNLTKQEKALLQSCVLEMKAILQTGFSQGLDSVNSKTQLDFSYESKTDLKTDYQAVHDLLQKLQPIQIKVAWGSDQHEDDIKDYSFDTEDEFHAFMHGVDESNGWMEYTTIGEGDYGAYETIEDWRKRNG